MSMPREDLESWLVEYIEEAEAVRDRFDEHRERVKTLERREQHAEEERRKPLPDLATLSARHGLIIEKLGLLGTTSSPEAWRHAARVARKRIGKWVTSHEAVAPDDAEKHRATMKRRLTALGRGRSIVGRLPGIEADIATELETIVAEQAVSDPRDGLAALSDVDDDLKQTRALLGKMRSGLMMVARAVEEPPMFAAMLGKTSALKKQISDGMRALAAAKVALRRDIEDLSIRGQLSDLDGRIERELTQLPLKADASAWLRESVATRGLLTEWLHLNGTLHTALDARSHQETLALLTGQAKVVTASAGFEARLAAQRTALEALSRDTKDAAAIKAIRLATEALQSSLVDAQGMLQAASNTYSGPAVFQGIVNALSSVDGELLSFVYEVESREREAARASLEGGDDDVLRSELNTQLTTMQGDHVRALQAEGQAGAWLSLRDRTERALRSWLSLGDDLDPAPTGRAGVETLLPLLQKAQVLVPQIQSLTVEFERRRTIEFAQVTSDPQKVLVLHASFERLHSMLEPLSRKLDGLQKQAQTVKWDLFTALAAETHAQLARLADFEDRLYRMYYDQESSKPDEKTTSEGGTLNLSPEEEAAVKNLVTRRVKAWLQEENRLRSRRREAPLGEDDVPEEMVDTFRRVARRMVVDRTSRYG
ncbi:MAG: hypothetical protein ACI8S6_005794 [Myxococcota bacterium]|jgi:hypothetical protein